MENALRLGWRLLLLPDHVDGDGDGLRGHAGTVVTGLVAQAGLDEVITSLRDDVGLDFELAGVDAELGGGIERQRKVGARRVIRVLEDYARGLWNRERRGDEEVLFGRVRVDMEAGGDAEVERDLAGLAGRHGDLFGKEVFDGRAACDGAVRGVG